MAGRTVLPWYVPLSNPEKDRLTFGVEIELSFATLQNKEDPDPDPNDPRNIYGFWEDPYDDRLENGRHHVAQSLIKAGIAAEIVPDPGDQPWKAKDPKAWLVKFDADVSMKPPADNRYVYQPIELNTPPLYYSKEALDEVKYVVTLLTSNYRCGLTTGLRKWLISRVEF